MTGARGGVRGRPTMSDLCGFMFPRSATGRSSPVPAPLWPDGGQTSTVEHRTDPAAVAEPLATIERRDSPVEELTRLAPIESIDGFSQEAGTNWRGGTRLGRRPQS